MLGIPHSRHVARRRKRALWAAALCSASFVTGHVLFGEEPSSKPSLIKQYLESKSDLVTSDPTDAPAKDESAISPSPASSRVKPIVIAADDPTASAKATTIAETVKSPPSTMDTTVVGALRVAAVSPASDLPFVPAQPLTTTNEVRPAFAQTIPEAKPAVAQASAAVAPVKSDDENLPPIVPAWAVPRPGTKKRPPPVVNGPQPPVTALPVIMSPPSSAPYMQAPPAPTRIELGGSSPPSPATLPQAPPPAPNKRAENSPLQRLPQVIEMTPRPTAFNTSATLKSPTTREPSLLPPPPAAQPLPLEIRNPHVSHAAPASFEMPLHWPSTSPQHVDDTNPLR